MICRCGGSQFCDVATVDGQEKVVLKCIKCKEIQPISRETLLRTESMGPDRQAMGRFW